MKVFLLIGLLIIITQIIKRFIVIKKVKIQNKVHIILKDIKLLLMFHYLLSQYFINKHLQYLPNIVFKRKTLNNKFVYRTNFHILYTLTRGGRTDIIRAK